MRKISLLLASAALVAPVAMAEHFYLGPTLSYITYDSDRFVSNDAESAFLGGLNLGYEFGENYAVEVNASTALDDTDADPASLQANLYHFFSTDRTSMTPFLMAGLSKTDFDSNTAVRDTIQAQIGAGFSKYLDEYLELRGDLRLYNALEGADAGDDIFDTGVNLALNYHFGKYETAPVTQTYTYVPPAETAFVAEPETRIIRVELGVLFEFDSAVVRSMFGSEIDDVVSAMKRYPDLMLVIEGHTDSIGPAEYNQGLSERRVTNVKRIMVEKGISASRITTAAYGETRPVADNGTSAGRALNRRVVGEIEFEEVVE